MTVRDIDRGAADLLRRMRDASRGYQVRVGVMGSEAAANKTTEDPEGNKKTLALTVVDIAAIHEFGAPSVRIPKRSWLRDWVDTNQKKIEGWIKTTCRKIVLDNVQPNEQWNRLGLKLQSSIQGRIEAGIPPAISDTTEKLRGPGIPLIHTGQFKSSITYVVERLGS